MGGTDLRESPSLASASLPPTGHLPDKKIFHVVHESSRPDTVRLATGRQKGNFRLTKPALLPSERGTSGMQNGHFCTPFHDIPQVVC